MAQARKVTPVVVLDNGAYTCKAGLATELGPRMFLPNCFIKQRLKTDSSETFVGIDIRNVTNPAGLRFYRPCERGFVLNWNLEHQIWDQVFSDRCLDVESKGASLVLTENLFAPPRVQDACNEIVFEYYGCGSLMRAPAAFFTHFAPEFARPVVKGPDGSRNQKKPRQEVNVAPRCCIVVDSGFSYTTILPILCGRPLYHCARRVDIGGQVLTSHLKEIVSYRKFDVMDETYLVNQIKEDCCYVSQDFNRELKTFKTPNSHLALKYVLPDYSTRLRGAVLNDTNKAEFTQDDLNEFLYTSESERITVPELLFSPGDIGINQAGIPESVVACVQDLPWAVRDSLLSTIILTGGCTRFRGFKERMETEIRKLVDVSIPVSVIASVEPEGCTWKGCSVFAMDPRNWDSFVSKAEYEERGHDYLRRKLVP